MALNGSDMVDCGSRWSERPAVYVDLAAALDLPFSGWISSWTLRFGLPFGLIDICVGARSISTYLDSMSLSGRVAPSTRAAWMCPLTLLAIGGRSRGA